MNYTQCMDIDHSTFAVTTAITLICPGETTQCITIKKPIHILQLPPACSVTLPNFHLPPQYENSVLEVNISLGHGRPKHGQHIIIIPFIYGNI